MKYIKLFLLIILLVAFAGGARAQAQNERRLTTTLIPSAIKGAIKGNPNEGLLWIRNDPAQVIFLQFDLSGLPPGLQKDNFKRCTLRLVAANVVYQPEGDANTGGPLVIVKGQVANADLTGGESAPSIVSLSTLSKEHAVALKATEALCAAVSAKYVGEKKIALRLFSESHKASTLLYSGANSGTPANPSNLPRLVIEYTLPPPTLLETLSWPQQQQNPEHTGRNPWTPFRNPTGFTLQKIALAQTNNNAGTIADYPLIYQGKIYLVNKILDKNSLVVLDFTGKELWRQELDKGVVQVPPVISRTGILYVVTKEKIAAYDLSNKGQILASYLLVGKPSDYTDLTVGNDGSLFVALKENDLNYVYGFTPALQPFLKSGPFGKGADKISTITVSADGRQIFAQIPAGALSIDLTDPAQQQTITLERDQDKPWEYYHTPLAGPADGVEIFSDFTSTASKGNVWGYAAAKRIWSTVGTLMPQPVLGANGLVYFIQDGALQGHSFNKIGAAEITAGAGLNITSNLVMDGANNIYFWDNGYLHGFTPAGQPLFEKINFPPELQTREGEGPERFIRLMAGPDGALWANNKNGGALYAFVPRYSSPDITLKQDDIKSQTVYRTEGTLAVGGVTVKNGVQILLQARTNVTFARGFTVQKGASLICRTGF